MARLSLLDHFSALDDPRQRGKVVFPLPEIMLLILCGTLAGAEDFVEIQGWGRQKLRFLRTILPFARGIPSHDTLNDVMNALRKNHSLPHPHPRISTKSSAQDQQHDFGQGIQHLAMLAPVGQRRKMVEKRKPGHGLSPSDWNIHESDFPPNGNPLTTSSDCPGEIDALLARMAAFSDEHFDANPEAVT